jgi:hypothetical protein
MSSNSKYEVHILSNGYSKIDPEGFMKANCTCTLIKGQKNIIVDTLTPWDGGVILTGLANHGLKPVTVPIIIFGLVNLIF